MREWGDRLRTAQRSADSNVIAWGRRLRRRKSQRRRMSSRVKLSERRKLWQSTAEKTHADRSGEAGESYDTAGRVRVAVIDPPDLQGLDPLGLLLVTKVTKDRILARPKVLCVLLRDLVPLRHRVGSCCVCARCAILVLLVLLDLYSRNVDSID